MTEGKRVSFVGNDGEKHYVIVDKSTKIISDEEIESSDEKKDGDQNENSAKIIYHVASNVSYRIKNGYASAANPKKWYGLKKIVIKSSVKLDGVTYKINAIDKLAFFGIDSLKSVTIGKNVTKIGSKAFMKCGKLNKITIKASNLTSVGKNCFKDISKKCTIYIVAKKAEYTKLVKLIKKKSGCPKKTKFKRVKP
ncbi:MAG: leucine-rich repeat protein [Eubacterium sp.]|nr:leucine-rich repeat protein [Eubacterium sp.]